MLNSLNQMVGRPVNDQLLGFHRWVHQLPKQLGLTQPCVPILDNTHTMMDNLSNNLQLGSKALLFTRLPDPTLPVLRKKLQKVDGIIDRVDTLLKLLPTDLERVGSALHRSRVPAAMLIGMLFGWVLSTIRGGQWLFLPVTGALAGWTAWRYRDLSFPFLRQRLHV